MPNITLSTTNITASLSSTSPTAGDTVTVAFSFPDTNYYTYPVKYSAVSSSTEELSGKATSGTTFTFTMPASDITLTVASTPYYISLENMSNIKAFLDEQYAKLAALDGYLPTAGGTMTGDVTVQSGFSVTAFRNDEQLGSVSVGASIDLSPSDGGAANVNGDLNVTGAAALSADTTIGNMNVYDDVSANSSEIENLVSGATPAGKVGNTLTFTGAVSATYDGSEDVTVDIPEGESGTPLYRHVVLLTQEEGTEPNNVTNVEIINTDSTAFTTDTLVTYLTNRGAPIPLTGYAVGSGTSVSTIGIYASKGNIISNTEITNYYYVYSDTVIQIGTAVAGSIPTSEAVSVSAVTYADGVATFTGTNKTTIDGTEHDISLTANIPIVAGDNVTIAANSEGTGLVVSASGGGSSGALYMHRVSYGVQPSTARYSNAFSHIIISNSAEPFTVDTFKQWLQNTYGNYYCVSPSDAYYTDTSEDYTYQALGLYVVDMIIYYLYWSTSYAYNPATATSYSEYVTSVTDTVTLIYGTEE